MTLFILLILLSSQSIYPVFFNYFLSNFFVLYSPPTFPKISEPYFLFPELNLKPPHLFALSPFLISSLIPIVPIFTI